MNNLDAAEINKFSSLANEWWDPNGPCATLHAINPCRLEFILQHAKLANKSVLDLGCGAGILSESLAKNNAQVLGVDASAELIACARQHDKDMQLDINYQNCTSEDLINNNANVQFDIITCMELLEHVPDPVKLIQDCSKLLKPGGQLFLSTINRNLKAYGLAILGAEYVLKLLPKHTHDYKKFIQPAELAHMCRNANLHLLEISGMKYQPFTKNAELCTNIKVNYLAYAHKEI